MYTTGVKAYFQTQVKTTSKEDLVVQLFEAAIRFLQQAKDDIEAKDYSGKGDRINRALNIINELDSSLNWQQGGEIANNLHSLYLYCRKRLLTASLKLDTEIIDEVKSILERLCSSFKEISRPSQE